MTTPRSRRQLVALVLMIERIAGRFALVSICNLTTIVYYCKYDCGIGVKERRLAAEYCQQINSWVYGVLG